MPNITLLDQSFMEDRVEKGLYETSKDDDAIELIEGKQPPYWPIYALSPVELETLKAYIETHLKTGFIRPSKCPAGAPILFDKKPETGDTLWLNPFYKSPYVIDGMNHGSPSRFMNHSCEPNCRLFTVSQNHADTRI